MRPVVTRRAKAVIAGLAAPLVLVAGCSSGKPAAKPASTTPSASLSNTAAVGSKVGSDLFGQRAKIEIPAGQPDGKLGVKVKIPGHGTKVAVGDMLVVNFTGKLWRDGIDLGSSYDQGQGPVSLVEGQKPVQMLAGWDEALLGQQAGSRVEVVVPPDKGFGAAGTKAGTIQISGTDTLVFDIDIVGVYSKADVDVPAGPNLLKDPGLPTVSGDVGKGDPKVVMPVGKVPPTTGTYKTVIQGSGPAVKKGQTIVVQYEGLIWRDGSLFDSSWSKGKKPFATAIGQGNVVAGWDEGLVGQNVGSRVLLVIPPDKGYGPSGQPAAGIQGTDTMVFVVDILDAG